MTTYKKAMSNDRLLSILQRVKPRPDYMRSMDDEDLLWCVARIHELESEVPGLRRQLLETETALTETREALVKTKRLAAAEHNRGERLRRLYDHLFSATTKMREALEAIVKLPGNLPDERLTTASGPNDARYRGEMIVSARQIARAALVTKEPDDDK